MSTGRAFVSIVVAFYNEEKAIVHFFAEMDKVAARLDADFEYVCVNDGSRDQTLALLRRELARGRRMRIINFARNFGKEAAMTAGLEHAKGDAIVVIDADLQDPPALIADFLAKWREGYDVVYGVRASRASDTMLKRATAVAFYRLFNSITSVPIPHDAGDFRLMDRRVVAAILALPERNRFMKGLFAWVGFKQIGVPFLREARVAGSTSWNYLRLWNFAVDGLTSFSIVPLRIASLAGALISLMGFAYAAFLIMRTLVFGVDVPGYASIVVIVLFLGGVQLVCLGLIGEYLGRLYIEAKQRPLYIVADVFDDSGIASHGLHSGESATSSSQ
ncbi:MAG TPA: glycosyltransferase family 2 protein [Rhizomicrobium sp.]|nr:glycosyltransferase family 2 protein [Rhizomicrobium sp.]